VTTTSLKTVPDTNVLLASKLATGSGNPNREYFDRWEAGEFVILFSRDTLLEYIEKLREKSIPEELIKGFLSSLLDFGMEVHIEYFHLRSYPIDSDDIAFLLCAHNGNATHLVTYDSHLRALVGHYPFKICGPVDFLKDLRQAPALSGAPDRSGQDLSRS